MFEDDPSLTEMSKKQRQAVTDIRAIIAEHFPAAVISLELPGKDVGHLSVLGDPDHIELLMKAIALTYGMVVAAERVRQLDEKDINQMKGRKK